MDGRRRQNILVVSVIAALFLVALVAVGIWDLGRECVRWSTRINVNDKGAVSYTRVCAEFEPIWPRPEE